TSESLRAEREQRLQAEIEEMLAAHVGRDQVRVSVAVELDREAQNVTERTFDPNSQVAVHKDTTEIEESSSEQDASDAVSVAGNLPNPEPAAGPGQANRSARTESRESANYEVSEVRRESQKPAGAVKKISVAVLVGGVWEPSADGPPVWRPQSEAELNAIRNLVQSAIGFDAERGDQVTIESLPFHEEPGTTAEEVAPGLVALLFGQLGQVAQSLAAVAVVFLALWFVARPIVAELRTRRGKEDLAQLSAAGTNGEKAAKSLDGAVVHASLTGPQQGGPEALPQRGSQTPPTTHERALVAMVDAVDRHPDEALGTLRRWLRESAEEEPAR
ncbi:MAG: flagellar M-ring protein FliF C-terminal domain-containing protein, partial [Geminicoccaceae bacterium]